MLQATDIYSSPLAQSAVLGAAGLWLLIRKHYRTGPTLIIIGALWLWACATPTFAGSLWEALASRYPVHPPASYPRVDAIVVVGGGPVPRSLDATTANNNLSPANPLMQAATLYRLGKAPVLVATGSYATTTAEQLLNHGLSNPKRLFLVPQSETTHEDARYSRKILLPRHDKRILLVTTRTHMPRTVATFRKQGFTVVPAPAASRKPRWISTNSPRPSKLALYTSRRCIHEYIGLLYYRARGWALW